MTTLTTPTTATTPVKPAFDPDLSPRSEQNRDAAAAQGLRFDSRKGCYVGAGGELVLDRFGQPY